MICIICSKETNNCLEYCKECYCKCGTNFYSYIHLCFVCKKNTYCKSCKQNIFDEINKVFVFFFGSKKYHM